MLCSNDYEVKDVVGYMNACLFGVARRHPFECSGRVRFEGLEPPELLPGAVMYGVVLGS